VIPDAGSTARMEENGHKVDPNLRFPHNKEGHQWLPNAAKASPYDFGEIHHFVRANRPFQKSYLDSILANLH
jgi:hypothetical protein